MKSKKINKKKINKIKQKSYKIKLNKNKTGGNQNNILFFNTKKISTQPNLDPTYNEIGLIHTTTGGAINLFRETVTNIANIFGEKGIETSIYSDKRQEALKKIDDNLKENQKICNLRIDTNTITKQNKANLFFINIYGTLLEKK